MAVIVAEMVMIIGAILTGPSQPPSSPSPFITPEYVGWTTAYAPGVMDGPVQYHGIKLDGWDGAIAVEDCGMIGQTWLIRPMGTKQWWRVVVADCAGRNAYDEDGVSWMTKQNVILELSYKLAYEFNATRGGIKVEVVKGWDG